MKNISKTTAIVAKIVEVWHWVGVAAMALVLILSFAVRDAVIDAFNTVFTHNQSAGTSFSMYDFDLVVISENANINLSGLRIGFVCGIILLAIWAMVFRNFYLIAKNTMKPECSFFCKDNLRMIKEIGIFAIASPVVSLIFSILARVILGHAEIAVSLNGFIIGLVVLFLTQFFAKGAELETEVEGLI